MHIPSERVYRHMRSESASLWIVPANDDELALLIKAPSSAIKGLIAGCPMHLLFGRKGSYLSTGVRILDMPDAPMLISGLQLETEEHQALARLLQERHIPVFLFNEMDICLAWTNLELTETDTSKISELVQQSEALYVGPFTPECSHVLDCFCHSADPTQTYEGASSIPIVDVNVSLEPWRSNHVSFIGVHDHHRITINDKNEGEMFERAIWASLESVFPLTLYKCPQVKIGAKTRELIDVFAFHEHGSFLIEAKDLSVLQAGFERNQERRTSSVQKQIKKAIAQLTGACKALARGERVFDASGKELIIVRDQPAHCIVLITELMHWGSWDEVEEDLMKAMRSTGAFFHLLDLREFITLLKGSSGKPKLFDYNLMRRCEGFIHNGSVHIRSQIAPKASPESPDLSS